MKKILFILLVIGISFSCNNDDGSNADVDLIGNWKLVEVYSDPGDGSGNFEAVDSEKTIEFKIDGTLSANGELCVLNSDANTPVNGTFSVSDFTINTPNCLTLTFEQNGNALIISIPCIEPCLAKYRKI